MECLRQPTACSSSISMKGTKRSPRRRLLLSSRVLLGHIGVGRGHSTRLWGSARPGVSNCRSHSPADPRARGVGSREPAIKSARARFGAYLRRLGGEDASASQQPRRRLWDVAVGQGHRAGRPSLPLTRTTRGGCSPSSTTLAVSSENLA